MKESIVTTNSIRPRSPHELLAIVPFVLGFHPSRSVVLMSLRDHRIGLTHRLDLPAPEDAGDVSLALLPSLIRENPDTVILVGFEGSLGESLPALEALTEALKLQAIPIQDRLVVRGGRWWSLDCRNPDCCAPEGSPVLEPAEVSRVVSEFVLRGVCPHPDREALARQVEAGPDAGDVEARIRSLLGEESKDNPPISRETMLGPWIRILDPAVKAPTITVQDAALAAVSLLDIEVGDGLIAWLCPGTLSRNQLSEVVQEAISGLDKGRCEEDTGPAFNEAQNGLQETLIRLSAMLPDEMATPALSLLASFAWFKGDGALAVVLSRLRLGGVRKAGGTPCCSWRGHGPRL